MVLDKIKSVSDDAYFNEDHVMFLINKYRTFLLKQKYSDVRKPIPESNYQTICVSLEEYNDICEDTMLKSIEKVPFLIKICNPRVYTANYFKGEITYINRERMRYVGYNDYMKNIIYASIGPDNYLYLKSCNIQFTYLKNIKVSGVFEDAIQASSLQCEDDATCDLYDRLFPLEDSLITPLIELVSKDLLGTSLLKEDDTNNAKDDFPDKNVRTSK